MKKSRGKKFPPLSWKVFVEDWSSGEIVDYDILASGFSERIKPIIKSISIKFPMEVKTYTILKDQDPCNMFRGKTVRINRFSVKKWIDVNTGVEMESTFGFYGALLDDNLNETGEETPLILFEEIEEILCA